MRFILALLLMLIFSNQSFAGATFSKVVSAAMDEIQSDTADEIAALLHIHTELQHKIQENLGNESLASKQCEVASRLARLYQIQGNLEKKREYLKAAADQGSKIGQRGITKTYYELAKMYEWGNGGPVDYKLATHYYSLAADLGDRNALENLVKLYDIRTHSTRDLPHYRKYSQMLADQGKPYDQIRLANLHRYGIDGPVDLEVARKYYQLSVDQGDPLGSAHLAEMLLLGLGGAKDVDLAMAHYKRAFKKGMLWAAAKLAKFFEKGEGLQKNLEEAIRYYRISGQLFEAKRLALSLAQQYEQGEGVEKSLSQAIYYYNIAEHPDDVTRLTQILRGISRGIVRKNQDRRL